MHNKNMHSVLPFDQRFMHENLQEKDAVYITIGVCSSISKSTFKTFGNIHGVLSCARAFSVADVGGVSSQSRRVIICCPNVGALGCTVHP
jgi:hypothetical protein